MINTEKTIEERYSDILKRIESASRRAGRDPAEVELVAVAKKHPPEAIREAADCGITIIGENKVQEAMAKIPECPGHLTWHMIGHLQTNKVKHTVHLFDMIHSVDSLKLLEAIHKACGEDRGNMPVCLEINVSGESTKFGLKPEELPEVLEASAEFHRVDIVGLMTMPPWTEEQEDARPVFRKLRELRTRCAEEWGFPLTGLSMGMSRDFEIAIEEGATWVRVGTDLFGPRKKTH